MAPYPLSWGKVLLVQFSLFFFFLCAFDVKLFPSNVW